METRKRLYKATTTGKTLTERVKKDRARQNETRNNRFNANRNIAVELDDSVKTPTKPAPIKLSQIKDKPAKLKAYIEQKRTNKLKEQLEQRSPFIPYVPVGRYVEKKEPIRKPKSFSISTPIKKALMSDGKILKKSTIKEIATTAKKENIKSVKKSKQEDPAKSRKKILGEFNNVQQKVPEEPKNVIAVEPAIELNDTFEIIASENENKEENQQKNESIIDLDTPEKSFVLETLLTDGKVAEKIENVSIIENPVKKNEDIHAVSSIEDKKSPLVEKKGTIPAEDKKELNQKIKRNAKIVVPVKRPNRDKNTEKKELQSKKNELDEKRKVTKSKKKSPKQEIPSASIEEEIVPKPVQKASQKAQSETYKFYKSSLNNQVAYISIQLKTFSNNLDSFINKLSEDMQSNAHQVIQQGNHLINEKMKGFEEHLEKFEASDPLDSKRVTEDDIQNYWSLLYEQVEKFKNDLQIVHEAKISVMKDEKKRRTRKTLSDTPTRRSRRIAETGDTPKHNPSTCFGCTPVSSSKANTPKSAKNRRTAFKKGLAFDLTSKF